MHFVPTLKIFFLPATLKTSLGKTFARWRFFILAQRPAKVCSFDSSSKMRNVIFLFLKKDLCNIEIFRKNFKNFEIFRNFSQIFEKKIFFPKIECTYVSNQEKRKEEVTVNFAELSILCIRFALSRKLHSLSEKNFFDFFY